MTRFLYARPETLDEALGLLREHGARARLLAGGTDLLVRLRLGHVTPDVVIDLKRAAGLPCDIVETEGCLRIGARVLMREVVQDARVRRHFPALVEAAAVVGSVQIRNRATLAGNICNASPAADTATALLVYDACVNVAGPQARRVPIAGFFTGPGRTVLSREEIVQSIDLPLPSEPAGAAFGRVTRRYGVDLATLNLSCLVFASGAARFAFGAVGPRPFLAVDETGVIGDPHRSAADVSAALQQLMNQASPISDVRANRDYRVAMLEVMSRRALASAHDRLRAARGDGPWTPHPPKGPQS